MEGWFHVCWFSFFFNFRMIPLFVGVLAQLALRVSTLFPPQLTKVPIGCTHMLLAHSDTRLFGNFVVIMAFISAIRFLAISYAGVAGQGISALQCLVRGDKMEGKGFLVTYECYTLFSRWREFCISLHLALSSLHLLSGFL